MIKESLAPTPTANPAPRRDPACGMTVDPARAKHSREHAGTTYYFCCESCAKKFTATPDTYLNSKATPPSPHASPATSSPTASHTHAAPALSPNSPAANTYTCPMHPEIRRDAPGACPICGMALEPVTITAATAAAPNPELLDMTRRFYISAALSIPILALAMSAMIPGAPLQHALAPRAIALIEFLLAAPVVLWAGWPFFQRGWASVVNRSLNMFTLIALGTGAAFLYSTVVLFLPGRYLAALVASTASTTSIAANTATGSAAGSIALPVYFEAAAIITTLVLLGQVLELRARSKTSSAIEALLHLAPRTSRVLRPASDSPGDSIAAAHAHAQQTLELDLPIDQVLVGDILRVRPGEAIPVDGRITEGSSYIDEAMVTGESVPNQKSPGDPVIAGTVNGTGSFLMRAERVGADTMLSRIVQMVATAQRTRAPIQRLADVVASYFVPVVLLVAAATAAGWYFYGPAPRLAHAIINAVAVLIIACPCALGLATPMSIMVGTGRGARAGVLIKNAEALETFSKVDTLVIDKTGTLTEGRPRLVKIDAAPAYDNSPGVNPPPTDSSRENEILALVASLELSSEHPLAAALVAAARDKNLALQNVENFRAVPGKGVTGQIAGREIAAGNLALMRELQIPPDNFESRAAALQSEGATVIFAALDHRIAALLAVTDPLKSNAAQSLDALRSSGLEIVMLTGDHHATASRVAAQLGIVKFFAEVLPDQKGEIVSHLKLGNLNGKLAHAASAAPSNMSNDDFPQRQHATNQRATNQRAAPESNAKAGKKHLVAMAGDGINDAPALAAADVGIAMGTGADVAIESAGITLLKGDLAALVRARHLSTATMRNIRQNLFFAFVYNALGIPLAAGLLYPFFGVLLSPIIASAAMTFSSVSVITNALRLRHTKV